MARDKDVPDEVRAFPFVAFAVPVLFIFLPICFDLDEKVALLLKQNFLNGMLSAVQTRATGVGEVSLVSSRSVRNSAGPLLRVERKLGRRLSLPAEDIFRAGHQI